MEVVRKNNNVIKKRKINLHNLDDYDENKIRHATQRLKNVIADSYVSHFDNISYFLGSKSNFSTSNIGCISECKKLKKELTKLGLITYFVSCKANGFSNPAGDALVKEAHVFLLYPSRKEGRVYFTIFDPGFRLDLPLSFYDLENSKIGPYLMKGNVQVLFKGNAEYPYVYTSDIRVSYKREPMEANIHWEFNPYYQTLNIDNYAEHLYQAIFSLKLMNYPVDLEKYLCIRAKIIEQIIEVYTVRENTFYSFDELSSFSKDELKAFFLPYFQEARLSAKRLNIFIDNIALLLANARVYVETVLDASVLSDYKEGKKLNR